MKYVTIPIMAKSDEDIPKLSNYRDIFNYVKALWDYYNRTHFSCLLYKVNFVLLNDYNYGFLAKYVADDSIKNDEYLIGNELIYFSPKLVEAEELFRQVMLREMYCQANNESNNYISQNKTVSSENKLDEDEWDFINFHTNKKHIVPLHRLRIGVCYNTFVYNKENDSIKKVTCRIVHKRDNLIYFVYYDALSHKDILHKTKYGILPFTYAGKRERKRVRGKIPISLVKQYQEKCILDES